MSRPHTLTASTLNAGLTRPKCFEPSGGHVSLYGDLPARVIRESRDHRARDTEKRVGNGSKGPVRTSRDFAERPDVVCPYDRV